MDYYHGQPSDGCDMAQQHYTVSLKHQRKKPEWLSIQIIAKTYCPRFEQLMSPPDIPANPTAADIFSSIRQTWPYMDQEVDQLLLERYQQLGDHLIIGAFERAYFYRIYENCEKFSNEIENYKKLTFSNLDQNNARYLLRNQNCFP